MTLLARYPFTTGTAAVDVPAGITASPMTGNGNQANKFVNTGSTSADAPVWTVRPTEQNRPMGHRVLEDSFEVTLTPEQGGSVDLTSVTFTSARGSATPRGFTVTSSVDGHTASLLAVNNVASSSYTPYTVDLTSLPVQAGPVTLRWYFHTPGSTLDLNFDGFEVQGVLTRAITGPVIVGDPVMVRRLDLSATTGDTSLTLAQTAGPPVTLTEVSPDAWEWTDPAVPITLTATAVGAGGTAVRQFVVDPAVPPAPLYSLHEKLPDGTIQPPLPS